MRSKNRKETLCGLRINIAEHPRLATLNLYGYQEGEVDDLKKGKLLVTSARHTGLRQISLTAPRIEIKSATIDEEGFQRSLCREYAHAPTLIEKGM